MAIKRTSRGFQVQWYDASGSFRKRTYRGIDKDTAKRIERDILAKRDRGEDVQDPRRAPTFKEAAEAWQAATRAHQKESTREQWGSILAVHLLPRWGDRRVSTLTEAEGLDLQRHLQDTAKLSPVRSNLILGVAKAVLAFSARRKWVQTSPFDGVRPLARPASDVDPLSTEEVSAFFDACPVWWRPWFTVAFWTGCRPSEMAALAWSDVSETTGTFRVRAGLRRGLLSSPKTAGSTRDVPMLPAVQAALRQQRVQIAALRLQAGAGLPMRDHVFLAPGGGTVDSSTLRRSVWLPTLRKARLRVRPLYQTRHTFASLALAAGEDPLWVSKTLGHSNAQMLFQAYARWISSPTRKDGSALARSLGG